MRELTNVEVAGVSGGVLPVLAAIGSFLTHTGVRTVGQYYLSRSLTVYSTYQAAEFVKDFTSQK